MPSENKEKSQSHVQFHAGQRIAELLKEHDKSQSDLARYLNVSRQSVNLKLSQEDIYSSQLLQMCDFFGITIDEWFGNNKGQEILDKVFAEHHVKKPRKLIEERISDNEQHIENLNAWKKDVERAIQNLTERLMDTKS